MNRRNFIRKTGATTAGIGLVSVFPATSLAKRVTPSDTING